MNNSNNIAVIIHIAITKTILVLKKNEKFWGKTTKIRCTLKNY